MGSLLRFTLRVPCAAGHLARYSAGMGSLTALALLSGCVAPPQQSAGAQASQPMPPPSTQVYFYPTSGQSEAQQDRDRYECYVWAVKQTKYDPSTPGLAPHQRVVVQPMPPPGADTAAGALTGAAFGAIAAGPRDAGTGAIIGAVAGAAIGAVSDAGRQAQAAQVQGRYDQVDKQRYAELERRSDDYRRAMSACLEGRGYNVD